jgi:hypothetical protein
MFAVLCPIQPLLLFVVCFCLFCWGLHGSSVPAFCGYLFLDIVFSWLQTCGGSLVELAHDSGGGIHRDLRLDVDGGVPKPSRQGHL